VSDGTLPAPSGADDALLVIEVVIGPSSESHFFVDLGGSTEPAGICVATWRAVPVGRRVVLVVTGLPGGTLSLTGRTPWLREACCDEGPGIGVTFDRPLDADCARIARFCVEYPPYYYDVEAA
jgi:hypothetical protein